MVGGGVGGWVLKMTASWLLSDWIRFVTLPPPFSLQSKIGKMDLCMILGPRSVFYRPLLQKS